MGHGTSKMVGHPVRNKAKRYTLVLDADCLVVPKGKSNGSSQFLVVPNFSRVFGQAYPT